MQNTPTYTDPEEFNRLIAQLPMACRVYELMPDDRLVFVKANPAADRLFKIHHGLLEGQTLEKAFPNFSDSPVPQRYREVLRTGETWSYHGVFYQDNGNFLGLFNLSAFRLGPDRMATFSVPQNNQDTEIIFHEKKMSIKNATISYPKPIAPYPGPGEINLASIQKLSSSRVPALQNRKEEGLKVDDIKFTDLFTIEELEKIQDIFTSATNVASIITMPDGRPITQPSNFCTLCDKIIRQTPKGLANCIHSDAYIGKPNTKGPTLRPCLSAGLWDCGASILIDEKHVANWLVGQVRLTKHVNNEKLRRYAGEIGADPDEFIAAYYEVPVMTSSEFKRISRFLFLFANFMSDMAYQNLRLVRVHKIQEQTSGALQASESRLRHLSSKLILTQEEERRQLAIELHDGIGQSLTAVKFSIDNILINLGNPQMDIPAAIRSASKIMKDSIADVRRMQVELRPRILDELGIIVTIHWFCREFRSIYSHICLEIKVDVVENMVEGQLKPAVFRIIQEAFNNAAKYCEGDRIFLSFIEHQGSLVLEIKDNGIGFDLDEVLFSRELSRGLGLDSMRERAELCNGHLDIISSPGKGTIIRGTWAVSPPLSEPFHNQGRGFPV